MKRLPRSLWVAALGFILSSTAHAHLTTQTITLSNGWYAILLEVEPEDYRCDSVFSNWPVSSVSVYVAGPDRTSYANDSGTVLVPTAEYLAWQPGQPAGVNSLNSVLAGKAYLIYATQACERVVTGRPDQLRGLWPERQRHFAGCRI